MADKSEKPVRRFTSLTAHATEDIDVRIEFDDYAELVPMRTVSFMRLREINLSVPDPTPPIHHVNPDTKMPVFDYTDAGYQRDVFNASAERMFRLIVESLRADIPGEGISEKVAYLKGLDTSYINGLMVAINQLTRQGEAQLLARAAGFQPGGIEGTTHLSADGLVKAAVDSAFSG